MLKGRNMHTKKIDRVNYALIVIILLYTGIFCGITIWRYYHYLHERSGDLLLFEQVVYNTAHNKPFYNNFSAQSHFGDHNSPILAIMVPFVYFIPTPYVLYIFSVLSVAISAIPIFLLCRDKLKNYKSSLLLTVAYLLLPGFVGQYYQSFHEMNLVVPFLTFAFYFFIQERFWAFLGMFAMALLVKEDVSLTLFMFAPYAFIKKKGRMWIITPALVTIVWFLLSVKIIIPFFNKTNSYGVGLSYFSSFGSSISDIILTILGKPLQTMHILFSEDKLWYLFYLLLPVGLVLPFFSCEILFALPSIILNLLPESDRFRLAICSIGSTRYIIEKHMSIIACIYLFIALIYSMESISSKLEKIFPKSTLLISLCIFVLVLYNDRFIMVKQFYFTDENIELYQPEPYAINKIITKIPNNATVTSNRDIANHLYEKRDVNYNMGNITTDYLILTRMDDTVTDANISKQYELVSRDEKIILLKKK